MAEHLTLCDKRSFRHLNGPGAVASQVSVTVTFTCTGEAYDQASALALAVTLLANQAKTSPGAGYALAGQVKPTFVSAAAPSAQGNIAIVVTAEGIWVYQFSSTQEQTLASLVAGKSKQAAIGLLSTLPGIANVQIDITGGNGQTLPTYATQISIVVQTVSGL